MGSSTQNKSISIIHFLFSSSFLLYQKILSTLLYGGLKNKRKSFVGWKLSKRIHLSGSKLDGYIQYTKLSVEHFPWKFNQVFFLVACWSCSLVDEQANRPTDRHFLFSLRVFPCLRRLQHIFRGVETTLIWLLVGKHHKTENYLHSLPISLLT